MTFFFKKYKRLFICAALCFFSYYLPAQVASQQAICLDSVVVKENKVNLFKQLQVLLEKNKSAFNKTDTCIYFKVDYKTTDIIAEKIIDSADAIFKATYKGSQLSMKLFRFSDNGFIDFRYYNNPALENLLNDSLYYHNVETLLGLHDFTNNYTKTLKRMERNNYTIGCISIYKNKEFTIYKKGEKRMSIEFNNEQLRSIKWFYQYPVFKHNHRKSDSVIIRADYNESYPKILSSLSYKFVQLINGNPYYTLLQLKTCMPQNSVFIQKKKGDFINAMPLSSWGTFFHCNQKFKTALSEGQIIKK